MAYLLRRVPCTNLENIYPWLNFTNLSSKFQKCQSLLLYGLLILDSTKRWKSNGKQTSNKFISELWWKSFESRTYLNSGRDEKLFKFSVTQKAIHVLVNGRKYVSIKLIFLLKIFDHFWWHDENQQSFFRCYLKILVFY